MTKRSWALALLPLVVVVATGCSVKAPSTGRQAARFGLLVTWDPTQKSDTPSAQSALATQCGIAAPTAATTDSAGASSSYAAVPGGTLTDTEATCLTASPIVKMVDILSGPAPGAG